MGETDRRNIRISCFAVLIAAAAFAFDFFQNHQINKLQFELNTLNYRPTVRIKNIRLSSFNEKIDSISISLERIINDTSSIIERPSIIETDLRFDLENIGNSNAHIVAVFCTDTISGEDKLRELIFRDSIDYKYMKTDNDFYPYWQLQPKDEDSFSFRKRIDFIKNETFTVHLLLLYRNDLGILYDTYYWAKFQKKDMILDIWVDPTTGMISNSRLVNNSSDYLKFIDDNIAYKIYSKKQTKEFLKIRSSIIE